MGRRAAHPLRPIARIYIIIFDDLHKTHHRYIPRVAMCKCNHFECAQCVEERGMFDTYVLRRFGAVATYILEYRCDMSKLYLFEEFRSHLIPNPFTLRCRSCASREW